MVESGVHTRKETDLASGHKLELKRPRHVVPHKNSLEIPIEHLCKSLKEVKCPSLSCGSISAV